MSLLNEIMSFLWVLQLISFNTPLILKRSSMRKNQGEKLIRNKAVFITYMETSEDEIMYPHHHSKHLA